MGTEAIISYIGRQCAPVLAGVKPSNLLIIEHGNQKSLSHVLRGSQVQAYLLHSAEKKDYWFLFERELLSETAKREEASAYLTKWGYETDDLDAVLRLLACRFAAYKLGKADFPHEMGILFGYPLNDVLGFIRHGGKNYKMSGYWKVYDDEIYAEQVFRLYARAKRMVLEMAGRGVCIPEICRACRGEV